MDDAAIEAMAAQLEAEVLVEDAKSRLEQIIGGDVPLTTRLIANRAGFLLLAAWLLRGAVAKEEEIQPVFRVDNEEWEHFFDDLVRREKWEDKPSQDTALNVKERVISFLKSVGCWSIAAVLVVIIVVGLATVFGWIFQ